MFEETHKDLDEIENLFTSNHKALCNLAYKILRDRSASEDIVQDVFLKLWNKREDIRIESTLKGYLFKAVANAALNELQRAKKIQFSNEITNDKAPTVEITYEESSPDLLEKKFAAALDTLPPKCKVIFVLSRYENLKYKEIAEQLDISIKTVETQMGIALDRLRTELKPFLTRQYLVSAFLLILSFIPFQ